MGQADRAPWLARRLGAPVRLGASVLRCARGARQTPTPSSRLAQPDIGDRDARWPWFAADFRGTTRTWPAGCFDRSAMSTRSLPSPGWTIGISSLVSLAALVGPAACGSTSTDENQNPSDAATDSRGTSPDAGGPMATEAGADAQVDAPAEASSAITCDVPPDLSDAALAQYRTVVEQNLSCSQNTDCVWAYGGCVDPCGVVTDEAGAATERAGVQQVCEAYNAACPGPILHPCMDAGPLVCLGGSCVHSFYLRPSAEGEGEERQRRRPRLSNRRSPRRRPPPR